MRQKIFFYNFERSRCNQNKRKAAVAPHITHLICSLLLLLTISLQLLANYSTFHLCLSWLLSYSCSLTETMPMKFQGCGEIRCGGSEKDRYFLKIPKLHRKLAREYKRGKFVFYFLNNAAKTCSYGLKISENIEIKHVFQSKVFFHLSSTLHTRCHSAFTEGTKAEVTVKCIIKLLYLIS